MDRLQFEFMAKASSDGKSNVLCITSITTEKSKTFGFPIELQPAALHKEIEKTDVFKKVKNAIKKRHQTRKVWINMTEEIRNIYIDDSGNMQFGDFILEEMSETNVLEEENTLTQILKRLVEKDSGQQNLKILSEKFIIKQYTCKSSNASQWIESFEKECERFNITEDGRKIETLRYFLDKPTLDWYTSMILKVTIKADWSIWKSKFCETYVNKGWNPITYALSFKYMEGSLVDYAVKKERLMLEVRKTIDLGTLIDIIAVGLPNYILHRIERESLKETEDLFNELNKYEYLTRNNNFKIGKNTVKSNYEETVNVKEPCKTCKKLNKGTRFHPEEKCWFRIKEDEKYKKYPIRQVNASIIEADLIEEDQKNE